MKDNGYNEEDAFDSEDTLVHDELTHEEDENFIEERKELVEELFERAEAYVKTNISLFKLKAVDKVASGVSAVIANVVVAILGVFFLIILSIAFAIWIGQSLQSMPAGFFIVAGFYGVLTLLFMMFGKSAIKKSIGSSIINDFLK